MRRGPTQWEVGLWMLVALAVVAAQTHLRGPVISNDGFQYVSTATNVLNGNGIRTSLIYYDAERKHGVIPAPLTTFPPVYPLAVAALTPLGRGNPETAAALVSLISVLLLVPLLAFAARAFNYGKVGFRVSCVLLLGNSWTGYYGTAVASEALFGLAAATAVLLLCRALALEPNGSAWSAIAGGALLGGTYWIRYAGVFLFAGACVWTLCWIALRRDLPRGWIAGMLAGAALIVCNMIRNILLIGTWQGGTIKVIHNPLGEVLRDLARAVSHWLLGGLAPTRLDPGMLVTAIAILGLIAYALRPGRGREPWRPANVLLCVVLLTYAAGLTYTASVKVISFDQRMFAPLMPILACLFAAWISPLGNSGASRRIPVILVSAFCFGYVLLHARHSAAYPSPADLRGDALVRARLSERLPTGGTSLEWIRSNTSASDVITTGEGQATGYTLQRPALSLPEPTYTALPWDEDRLHLEMNRFRSRYLIVYPQAGNTKTGEHDQWPFITKMLAGEVPAWLEPAASNGQVAIFRRR